MSTMLTILFFTLLAVLGIYLGFGIVSGLRSYFAWRGKRLVRCPETLQPAAVEVDAGRARRFSAPRIFDSGSDPAGRGARTADRSA